MLFLLERKPPEAQRFETIRSIFTPVSAGSVFPRLTRVGFSCISVDFGCGAFLLGAVREKEASATGTWGSSTRSTLTQTDPSARQATPAATRGAWQEAARLLESNDPPEIAPFVVFIQTRRSRMADETRAVRTVETGEHRDRVLIVEDEDNARKGYEQLLQRWGYEVLGVASAEVALAKFSNIQPDTVIADVELPGMNGLDLLKQLGDDL